MAYNQSSCFFSKHRCIIYNTVNRPNLCGKTRVFTIILPVSLDHSSFSLTHLSKILVTKYWETVGLSKGKTLFYISTEEDGRAGGGLWNDNPLQSCSQKKMMFIDNSTHLNLNLCRMSFPDASVTEKRVF